MSYVNAVIGYDETIHYKAVVSYIPFIPYFIAGLFFCFFSILSFFTQSKIQDNLFFALIFFIGGLFFILLPIIIKMSTELAITSKRIIAKTGLIQRHTIEINISKIESIKVSQSILGRLFNYGDIQVIGTGGTREPITKISNPLAFRRKFDEVIN